jgi:acetyltransferase-like isoleucine patch superfamily enzyme
MQKCVKVFLNHAIIYIYRLFKKPLNYWRDITATCIDESNVKIGRHTYGIKQGTICLAPSLNSLGISVGSFCSIAPGVVILANADHPINLPSTFPFRSLLFPRWKSERASKDSNPDVVSRGAVEIGHDVWIGQNALILSGVNIGTGAVIGAGSVVTKDVPPYAIAVGNPARVIQYRFSPEIIERLLKTEWWSLSDENLLELEPFLYSRDINNFMEQVEAVKFEKNKSRHEPEQSR